MAPRQIGWANQPGFNGKMSTQRPDASVDVPGHACGAFLVDWRPIFQREIQEILSVKLLFKALDLS